MCTATVIANQINDTDANDPPDNMTSDFVFTFGVKPEAIDDARNATRQHTNSNRWPVQLQRSDE
jgi:hypothetical protein